MANMEQSGSSSLVRVRRGLIKKGPSLLARRALDDLAALLSEPPSGPERPPFHVLYATMDEGIGNICHALVMEAIGTKRHVFPVWAFREEEIRLLWTQQRFHCAFLLMNNIVVSHAPNIEQRIRKVLALIPWLRDRGSSTIIALSGWLPPDFEKDVLRSGADRFLPLPFPPRELLTFLTERFGRPTSPLA